MRRILFYVFLGMILTLNGSLWGFDECPVFPNHARVKVQYQARHPNSKSWTTYSITLNDVRSESMIRNQLLQRHPGYLVRILSAATGGQNIRVKVRYQIRRNNSSWTTVSTSLWDAMTESMARNQIKARYPGSEVRILSMSF